jgi:hypothetical protein
LFASSVDAGNLSRMNSGGLSNLSIYRSIYPSIYLSIVIYILICIYLYIHVFIHVSDLVNLSIYLTIYLWSTYLAFARTHMYILSLSIYVYILTLFNSDIIIYYPQYDTYVDICAMGEEISRAPLSLGPRQRDSCRWCPSPALGGCDVFLPHDWGSWWSNGAPKRAVPHPRNLGI